jgi:hypothetical protein
LSHLLGEDIVRKQPVPPSMPETREFSNLGVLALEHYNKAKDYLRQGNWAAYGRELEEMEKILNQMAGVSKEEKE